MPRGCIHGGPRAPLLPLLLLLLSLSLVARPARASSTPLILTSSDAGRIRASTPAEYATHEFDDVVSAVVRRALGKSGGGADAGADAAVATAPAPEDEQHAAADALFGGASRSSSSSSVIVVIGTQLRTGDLRSGAVMAPLNALVRRSGSAAVLPHVAHGAAAADRGSGCPRARAAERLRDQAAAAGFAAHVFGCGASVDSAASASQAAAVLAAAGWAAGSGAPPLLLVACTPPAAAAAAAAGDDGEEEGAGAAKGDDARAMAEAHDTLAGALGEGAAHVGVLAVRPQAGGERRLRRRSLQQHQGLDGAGFGFGVGGLGAAAAAGGAARPSVGANGQYQTCDARCQSQVKWLQGILAASVMVTALVGGLTSLNALQGPSRFEKPDRE